MNKISIPKGNNKLGSIPAYSLPPDKTCKGNPCHKKGCYYNKFVKLRPTVKKSVYNNWELLKKHHGTEQTIFDICRSIEKNKPNYFRWFVGGDIPSQLFLDGMYYVALTNPETKFLCYTKKYNKYDFSNTPKNLQIVYSAWVNIPLPPDDKPIAFYQDGTEKRVYNAITCKGKCDLCFKCWHLSRLKKNVVFNRH